MSLIPSVFGNRSRVFDPFSLDVWDPFQEFPPFSRDLARTDDVTRSFANTQIDWKETSDSHIFKADLPGLKKDEVKIEVEEDKVLQISGERKREKEEKNDKWHRVERSYGNFKRRFRLPENAKVDEIKAAMAGPSTSPDDRLINFSARVYWLLLLRCVMWLILCIFLFTVFFFLCQILVIPL